MTTSNNNSRVFLIIIGIILFALILISIINANRTNVVQSSKNTTQVANEEVLSEQKSNVPAGDKNEHQYENRNIFVHEPDVKSTIWGYFEWLGYEIMTVDTFNHNDMSAFVLNPNQTQKAYNWCSSKHKIQGFAGISEVRIYYVLGEKNNEYQMLLVNTFYQEADVNKWIIETIDILRLK